MFVLSFKQLLLLFAVFILCFLFYFYITNDVYSFALVPMLRNDLNLTDVSQNGSEKYIFSLTTSCSGIGNQMYRIAALYALGRYSNINRTPGLNIRISCLETYFKEFSDVFPNVVKVVKFEVSFNKEGLR